MAKIKVLELFADVEVGVSDTGDIYTFDHNSIRENGRVDNRKGKKLKSAYDRYGYKRVVLSSKGERHTYLVHRLVAKAYIPNPENKPTVNHINGKKDDNRVANLEWATQSEQRRHSIQNHLCDKNIKALKESNRKRSRKVLYGGKTFASVSEACRILGVSDWQVRKRGVFND